MLSDTAYHQWTYLSSFQARNSNLKKRRRLFCDPLCQNNGQRRRFWCHCAAAHIFLDESGGYMSKVDISENCFEYVANSNGLENDGLARMTFF